MSNVTTVRLAVPYRSEGPLAAGRGGRGEVAIVSRREGSFDWVSAPDEGDAAAASSEIQAWLETRDGARDWDGVLGRLRDVLTCLVLSPRIRNDARCRVILGGLRSATELAEIDAAMADLAGRVEEMRAASASGPTASAVVASAGGAPRPARRTFRL